MSFLPQFLVQSSPDAQRLRDIKPPIEVTQSLLPFILIGAILLVAIVVLVWLYLRSRKFAPIPQIEEEITILPHEIALERLKTLDETSCDMETFHTQISHIIREYIAVRYNLPALELTTTGLLLQMSRQNIDETYLSRIQVFLDNCDRVKFTKYDPNRTDVDDRMVDAHWFVNETKTDVT